MATISVREQLHKQIDALPDHIVQQIADFALFMMAKWKHTSVASYVNWQDDSQWQDFALEQFFRDESNEVTYSLKDAQEVYHP